ncbi:Protein jagunal like [Heracleum sosnowskyi]|uniref:Protein jagunal like n=1 Tax=Heracleum sosnowskyi TaxID=360622 RepID=A0AAD8J851_9APIA|nr:Protein jagunal like [Heracleum sosnowskyi]
MQQRRSSNGRPSGTDGSDFSYRMVVDSRYTKVAEGKSRLSILILTQAVVQLLGALLLLYSYIKEERIDQLAVSSTFIYFVSLLIGELGRKRSRAKMLKFYIVSSSLGMLLSIVSVLKSNILQEVVEDSSGWEAKKFELISVGDVLVGLLVQILSISTTTSLISNMSPPKRSS